MSDSQHRDEFDLSRVVTEVNFQTRRRADRSEPECAEPDEEELGARSLLGQFTAAGPRTMDAGDVDAPADCPPAAPGAGPARDGSTAALGLEAPVIVLARKVLPRAGSRRRCPNRPIADRAQSRARDTGSIASIAARSRSTSAWAASRNHRPGRAHRVLARRRLPTRSQHRHVARIPVRTAHEQPPRDRRAIRRHAEGGAGLCLAAPPEAGHTPSPTAHQAQDW